MTAAPVDRKAGDRPGLIEVTPLAQPERLAVSSAKAHALSLRKKRARKLVRRLAIFVLAPTLVAIAYFGFVASAQYESYTQFTVQSSELRPTMGMEGLLAGLGNAGGGHDALEVRDYVLSRDMLTLLNKDHGAIAHYKDRHADFLSRLNKDASFEEAYEYFGHKIYADYDQQSGAVTLRIRAFSAEKAEQLSAAILQYSEEMVNKISERERRDRTAYAEAQVNKAEERLVAARKAIVELQQKHDDINPLQTATATMTIRTGLEIELAKARAELMQLKSFMNEGAPQVLAVEEKVKSLSAQVSGQSIKLVDPSKPKGLNTAFADFEGAMVEKEFAQKAYESTMATLEVARADADRQHRYVAVIAAPSKPDMATYPHRVRSILAAFVMSFLLLGIGSLMGAAVREHSQL